MASDRYSLLERVEGSRPLRWLRALAPVGGVLSLVAICVAIWQLQLARETADRETRLTQTRMLVEIQRLASTHQASHSRAIGRYLEQLVAEGVLITDLDLQGVALRDLRLARARVENVVFSDLQGAVMRGATLTSVAFNDSDIPDLTNATLQDVYFRRAAGQETSSMRRSNLKLVSFATLASRSLPDLQQLPREGATTSYVRLVSGDDDAAGLRSWAEQFCGGISVDLTAVARPEAYTMFEPATFHVRSAFVFRCQSQ